MLPQEHFVYGFFFAALLLLIFSNTVGLIGFMIIVLSTVLIDFDHHMYHLYTKQEVSLANAYKFFRNSRKKFLALSKAKRAEYYSAWCMFHGVEALIIALLLTFFVSEYFGFVFIGMAFHLILDYNEQWRLSPRIDRISSAYDFLKFRKLQNINDS